jgi:hypothetical protein
MSETKFGLWTAPESPITVEYSIAVIEEMRHRVAEGFQRLSRGGIEVGGVLYGARDGRTLRITAVRPIACEHARGPAFILSDKDRMALNEQLTTDKDDPQLESLISVGWFLSHTRSDINLSESDLEIYSIFFPAPWQVTLVVRPGRGGSMRAGFFVRETDGTVHSDRSYQDFNFPDRLAGVLDRIGDRPPRERGAGHERRPASVPRAESALRETSPREKPAVLFTGLSAPNFLPPPKRRRKWPWLAAWAVVVLVAAILGLRYWMPFSPVEPISLVVAERDGQLQIHWNHAAKPVAKATRGSLMIVDGGESRTLSLSRQELATGNFTYMRKTGDIEVRMMVEDAGGGTMQEASRFLGKPPAASATPSDPAQLEQRRSELDEEVRRLRQVNGAQAARIQQLERTLQILRTRLGAAEKP